MHLVGPTHLPYTDDMVNGLNHYKKQSPMGLKGSLHIDEPTLYSGCKWNVGPKSEHIKRVK